MKIKCPFCGKMVEKSLICAVYMRMSDDDQIRSIPKQTRELVNHIEKNGYHACEKLWYKDEGKSGVLNQDRRVDFQRLLLDSNQQQFSFILVWNTSRFGRLDSIDAAFSKQILRNNGIYLESVMEGKIDWNTFEGRMVDTTISEMNHAYSVKLSREVISGRVDALLEGFWVVGRIPFGYDRLIINAKTGEQIFFKGRGTYQGKKRGWNVKLLTNDEEAKAVIWIFEQYANKDISIRHLAKLATAALTLSPSGKGYQEGTIRQILNNPAYIGRVEIGVKKRKVKKPKPGQRGKIGDIPPTYKENSCPRIIAQTTWEAVQKKTNQPKKPNLRQGKTGLLSGILVCGHCGNNLQARCGTFKSGKAQKRIKYNCYICVSGVRYNGQCPQWNINTTYATEIIASEIASQVDKGFLPNLAPDAPVQDQQIITGQVERLEGEIAKATKKYLAAPDFLMPAIAEEIKKMREKQQEMKLQQEVITKTDVKSMDKATVLEMVKLFRKIARERQKIDHPGERPDLEALRRGRIDPMKLRNFLKAIGMTVRVTWTPLPKRGYRVDTAHLKAEIRYPQVLRLMLDNSTDMQGNTDTPLHNDIVARIDRFLRFQSGCQPEAHLNLPEAS